MKYRTSIVALAVGLLIAGHAIAQGENELPLVPLPSIFDFTCGGGWGVALGFGVEYETAYDGSDEYEFEIDPAGAIQWRDGNHLLFWEGMELGWRGRLDGTGTEIFIFSTFGTDDFITKDFGVTA